MTRRILFRTLLLCLSLAAALSLSACLYDLPPDDGTPAPADLDGVYAGDWGNMEFNGDGSTVRLYVAEGKTGPGGLASGTYEGTYVFLFDGKMYRYDKADEFRLMIGGETYRFSNSVGKTSEDQIVIRPREGTEGEIVFRHVRSESQDALQ